MSTYSPSLKLTLIADGKCRLTCTAEYPEFQDYLKNGGQLQDADGNLMTPEQAKDFVRTLP